MRCSGIRGQARRRSRCGVPRTGQSDQSKERSCGLSNPYYLLPIEKSSALVNQKQKLFTSWHLLPCRVRVDLEVRTGLLAEMRLIIECGLVVVVPKPSPYLHDGDLPSDAAMTRASETLQEAMCLRQSELDGLFRQCFQRVS